MRNRMEKEYGGLRTRQQENCQQIFKTEKMPDTHKISLPRQKRKQKSQSN